MKIAHIPDRYKFVSDSQSVQAISTLLGINAEHDYATLFVETVEEIDWFMFGGLLPEQVLESIQDVTFVSVWGLEGIVPWTHKFVDELYPNDD